MVALPVPVMVRRRVTRMESPLSGATILTHNNGLQLGPIMTEVRCLFFFEFVWARADHLYLTRYCRHYSLLQP